MKATQPIRTQLGLTQEAMSMYLRISKSQLAMYESGKRDLPTAALVKLAAITLFLDQHNSTENDAELLKKQELELEALLIHQIKELKFKKLKEQRRLDAIQKKYNQNLQLRALALYLQKNNFALAEVLLQQATKGMEQNGLLSQTKLKMKLESLTSQLDYIHSLK